MTPDERLLLTLLRCLLVARYSIVYLLSWMVIAGFVGHFL